MISDILVCYSVLCFGDFLYRVTNDWIHAWILNLTILKSGGNFMTNGICHFTAVDTT